MQSFYYKALDKDGETREGKRVARSREALSSFLDQQGLTPVTLEQRSSFWLHPINHKERLARFFRNLNLFLKSGLELLPALEQIRDRFSDDTIQACIETIIDDLRTGLSFGESLRSCDPYFPASAHRICAVAEETGNLENACDELAGYFSSQYDFLNDLYSMLLYPLIVLVVGFGVSIFLFSVVVPQLHEVVPEDQSLPWISEVVFSIGSFMSGSGFWFVIAGIALMPFLLYWSYRSRLGQAIRNSLLLQSELYRTIKTHLFCLSMAMCVRVGMDITRSLELARNVIGHPEFQSRMNDVMEDVRQGRRLTDSLETHGFDRIPLDTLRAGEESGNLEEVFTVQAELLNEEVSRRLERLLTVIEPLVILSMATFVAIIVASIMLPILSMSSAF